MLLGMFSCCISYSRVHVCITFDYYLTTAKPMHGESCSRPTCKLLWVSVGCLPYDFDGGWRYGNEVAVLVLMP